MQAYSKVSIIIPTLNSGRVLSKCLKSIISQTYKNLEILIIDGGSSDATLKIAKKYRCKVFKNPLKTAEAGKAVGLKNAKGNFIAFIDSDNVLPNTNWLKDMLIPFIDSSIIGSEPISFTYRKNAGYIERYSALLGANDPYAYINGNYDRYSHLSKKWTNLKLETIDKINYLKVKIDDNRHIPTFGANGTIFIKSFLDNLFKGSYLFDIDIIAMAPKPIYFAKVKTGIIHSFCESSLTKFLKKQQRRLSDYYQYKDLRQYLWSNSSNTLYFSLYSLLIIPPLVDALRGFFRKPDPAWFFHPLACFLTWWIYAIVTIKYKLNILNPINRQIWQQ
ncbi:MAG: Glycosyl transferase [Candidatus Shapirobacteria bacterium GW2011_GWE1_38_10]|uniref:Glycosyl transferase n=1 Tax=Candidatus Shapirobacteria bacterium GW2011_GWE1_38_10 TaxID=1618488 RepID=A0A0G0I2N1_9BACT|nr:MAG: Glycosyl transferase [Candidatus Shapirobacteria bacterium GW2011_GWF2_37_20]KKQ48822.1 MAG: Glycosyl transferase [Candidatus Shapirobacteria bacterium GW2011_GWE1_38_10]KKQ63257.1 MAG: Glycosyl transferase [Candidatus Shapirobacteria bacterium GW2011_GWF1_38_23]